VSVRGDPLAPALESAAEELARRARRWEVFARCGVSSRLMWTPDAPPERRESRELGVACRVSARGRAGFAAAAGSAARAAREAALAALDAMRPAPDPLPPREALATEGDRPREPEAAGEAAEAFVGALAEAFGTAAVRPVQLRLLTGASTSALATGEGGLARANAAGVMVEALLAPPTGPWRHVHVAAPRLADIHPEALAARATEACLLTAEGDAPARQLADVLLAPPVAAPLIVALAQHLAREADGGDAAARARVSPTWHLVDERAGPTGLLPLPWDGEGLPSRRIVLLEGGRIRERLATWERARRTGEKPGGAVRPSYRHPPFPGPCNLVVLPTAASRQADLLARLESGFYLVLPAGPLRVDLASGRFLLRAAAVGVRRGRPVAAHPLVDLLGSFRRLLSGLAATGGDAESFSLAAAVTTPSLLVRRLEIA
jgi:PmbA protein